MSFYQMPVLDTGEMVLEDAGIVPDHHLGDVSQSRTSAI